MHRFTCWSSIKPNLSQLYNHILKYSKTLQWIRVIMYVPWINQWTDCYWWKVNFFNRNLGNWSDDRVFLPLLKAAINGNASQNDAKTHDSYPNNLGNIWFGEVEEISSMDWWRSTELFEEIWGIRIFCEMSKIFDNVLSLDECSCTVMCDTLLSNQKVSFSEPFWGFKD